MNATFNSCVMNSIFRVKIALVFVIMMATQKTQAQFTPSKWEIGINAGTLIYQGDLSESALGDPYSLQPAVELWVSRSLDDYSTVRANLLQGSLGADESTSQPHWRRHRNFCVSFSCHTIFFGIGVGCEWQNLLRRHARFSPDFFAGCGFAWLILRGTGSCFDTNYYNANSTFSQGLAWNTAPNALVSSCHPPLWL